MALKRLVPPYLSSLLTGFKPVSTPLPCSRCTSVFRTLYTIDLNRNTHLRTRRAAPTSCVIRQSQVTFSSSVELKQCWQCQSEVSSNTEFCLICKSLQPLNKERDHFGVLGIPKNFSIDTKALTKRFRLLQGQYHPDRYTVKPEREQQFAHDHSSAVNKAYRCLLHPVTRAVYLLDLAGQPLHEGQLDLNPEFLMAVMEMNEELAEAEDKDAIQAVAKCSMKILDSLLSEADAAFSSNDINKARVVVAKIKYYNSIYERVKALEREHGIVE